MAEVARLEMNFDPAMGRALGSATAHEAMGRRGLLPVEITARTDLRLCAPVMTVTTGSGTNLALHHGIDATPPGWALIVAPTDHVPYGYWGDLMTALAQQRGIAGLVIDGGVRDIDEIRRAGFATYSRFLSPQGTDKRPLGSVGKPITIGGVEIAVGDIVVADNDGVAVVPQHDAEAVLTAALRREAIEAEYRAAIESGRTLIEIHGWPMLDQPDDRT